MLPASGAASPEARGRLDAAVRKALGGIADIKVQPAKVTGEQLSMFIDLNAEVCDNDDLICLSKLGILAEVDLLLIVEASGQRTLEVELTLVNVERSAVVRTVDGEVRVDDQPNITALVERVFQKAEVPTIVDVTTPTKPVTSTDTEAPVIERGDGVDETKLNGTQFAGVTLASIGGGLAGLGLLGALSCEAIFWTGTGAAQTREDVIAPLGSALWIATIVGGVAAASGGALYLAGAPEGEARRAE